MPDLFKRHGSGGIPDLQRVRLDSNGKGREVGSRTKRYTEKINVNFQRNAGAITEGGACGRYFTERSKFFLNEWTTYCY